MIEFYLAVGSSARAEEPFPKQPRKLPTRPDASVLAVPSDLPAMSGVQAPDAGSLAQQSLLPLNRHQHYQRCCGLEQLAVVSCRPERWQFFSLVGRVFVRRKCITSPQSGTTITSPVPIQAEAEETGAYRPGSINWMASRLPA